MMAAATATKKGRRRSDLAPRRPPTSPPRSPAVMATEDSDEPRRTLRPRRRRPLLLDDFANFDDYLHDDEDEEEEDEEQRRKHRKLKLVLKLHPTPSPVAKRKETVAEVAEQRRRRSRSASAGESRTRRMVPAPATSSDEPSSSYVDEEEDEEAIRPPLKRRLGASDDDGGASNGSVEMENEPINVVRRRKDSASGISRSSVVGTQLPEKKLLEAILDKLQKKDKYKVFAEPVDPEELPDYYDVIEHPMNYGTVRKKLARNAYHSLEQFEDDVFLICSNAMQYNAPDTVYFRQARSMQEIGRKEFESLKSGYNRDESNCRPEEKIRVDSVEHKIKQACSTEEIGRKEFRRLKTQYKGNESNCKLGEKIRVNSVEDKTNEKNLSRTVQEPMGSDISSATTRVPTGDACALVTKPPTVEPAAIISCLADGSSSLGESKSEKVDELSVKDSPSNLVKKPFLVDEHRRDTYTMYDQQPLIEESESIFDVLEGEPKQLVSVGFDVEYSYARSLAYFAAYLGPIGWKIASERIASALPAGVKFGPGWVGEYEPLSTPVIFVENHHQQKLNADSSLQSNASLAKHSKLEVMNKINGTGNGKLVSASRRSQIDRKTSSMDSDLVKEGNDCRRPRELMQQLFSDTSEKQPRFSAIKSKQMREKVTSNLATSKSKDIEQTRVSQSSAVNSSGTNGVLQRSEFCSQAVTFKSSGIIPFQSAPLQPRFLAKVEPQAEASRNCVTSDSHVMHADESVNRRYLGSSGRDSLSNIGFISKNQPVLLGNWQSSRGHEHGVIDCSRQMESSKFIKQASITNRCSDIPFVQSSAPPVNREDQNSAAATAARAWMSVGASPQSKTLVSNAGQCSIQTESTSAAFNTTWRTPVSSPRHIDDSKVPGFRRPSQVIGLESQIQNQGLVIFPQLVPNDLARFRSSTPWQGLGLQTQKHNKVCPPDLNISFQQQPGSPVMQSSGTPKDSQQPDLALQL